MQCKAVKVFYVNGALSIISVRLASPKCCTSKLEGNSSISIWFLLSSRSKRSSALSELYGKYGSKQAYVLLHEKIPIVKSFIFRRWGRYDLLDISSASQPKCKEGNSVPECFTGKLCILSYFYYFYFKLR